MNRRDLLKLFSIPVAVLSAAIPSVLKPKSKRTKVVITQYNEVTGKPIFTKEYTVPGTVAELKQNDKIDIDTIYQDWREAENKKLREKLRKNKG